MRTWLITGCSTGIGRGIAKAVLNSGDQAVVTARNISKIQEFEEKYPDTCIALSLDLTDESSMENAVKQAYARFGRIDVLVNNAGYGYRAAIEESEEDEIDLLFRTNVFGPAKLMNLCLPRMREEKAARVADEKLFFDCVKAGFGQRRKTLKNALAAGLDLSKEETGRILQQAGIEENRRAETLSIGEFAAIANVIAEGTPEV